MGWLHARSAGMRALRRFRASGGGAAVVLTYHRVQDLTIDPLRLAIAPSLFAEHVAAVAGRYELMTAGTLFRHLSEGSTDRKSVV